MFRDGGISEVGGGIMSFEKLPSPIEEALMLATEKIDKFPGALNIEQNVKRAIIEPILQACGWDTTGLVQIQSEYPVAPMGVDKVDYALFDEDGDPCILIEAKRLNGITSKSEEQLFKYAKYLWAPILILTDGNVWNFYINKNSAEAPAERGYYRVELSCDESILKGADVFNGCLCKSKVRMARSVRGQVNYSMWRIRQRESGRIRQIWRTMDRRDRSIIQMRLGLHERPATLSEVSERFGLLPERILQVEQATYKMFCDHWRREESAPRNRREKEIRAAQSQ